jgi:pectate lyase
MFRFRETASLLQTARECPRVPRPQAVREGRRFTSPPGGKLVLLACLIVAACEAGFIDVGDLSVTPASVSLDVSELELVSGREVVVQATVQDARGKPVNLGTGSVQLEWSTSNERIATVTPQGRSAARVRGVDAGTVEITATAQQGYAQAAVLALLQGGPKKPSSASIHVRVSPAGLVQVSGSGQTGPVATTLPAELVMRAVGAEGQGVANVDIEFVPASGHGSVQPTSVVTDEQGLARTRWTLGLAPGTMRAEARAPNRLKLDPVTFTATAEAPEKQPGEPSRVEVSPASALLRSVGETVRVTAIVRDSEGTQLSGHSVRWLSRDPATATVDSTGLVRGEKPGRASIIATVATVADSSYVEVQQVAASVTITPTSATLEPGATAQFAATVKDATGSTIPSPDLTWTSSNSAVATVDGKGLVTAKEAGSATIRATSGTVHADASVTVQAPPPPPPPPPSGLLPAFPGAEGWGASALNECRKLPLVVHQVTNTNDSGTGSLRDILENRVSSSQYDIVIFRTGGTIQNEAQILLRRDCVYVAGQTAPGDGILIRSHPTSGHNGQLIRIVTNSRTRNIAVRYLRLRHGQEGGRGGGGIGVIGTGGGRDIILDHLSATWGGENQHIQISQNSTELETTRTSVQNSIMAEGFGSRGAMLNIDVHPASSYAYREHSFHRNLLATMGQRFPRVHAGDANVSKAAGVEVVNNVMYNPWNQTGEAVHRSVVEWVKNYQDVGPHRTWSQAGINRWEHYGSSDPIDPNDTGSLYIDGNHITGYSGPEFESWVQRYDERVKLPASMQRFVRMAPPPHPIVEQSALAAREWVLDNAGASRRIDCSGNWVDNRDAVDTRIVEYVRNRTGPTNTSGMTASQIHGSWPAMSGGTACADTNRNGLPDQWENRYFGCATCADPAAVTRSGYLVIEHYLNGTDPLR